MRSLQKIFKSSLVADFVSRFRTASQCFVETLKCRAIYILIVGVLFAHSPLHPGLNIKSGYQMKTYKPTVSHWDVKNNCKNIFMNSHGIFLINKMHTHEGQARVKLEIIIKQRHLNYNQAPFNLAGITFPLQEDEKKERSDLFYYILGILILIVSAFILRQRYKQYLEEKNK